MHNFTCTFRTTSNSFGDMHDNFFSWRPITFCNRTMNRCNCNVSWLYLILWEICLTQKCFGWTHGQTRANLYAPKVWCIKVEQWPLPVVFYCGSLCEQEYLKGPDHCFGKQKWHLTNYSLHSDHLWRQKLFEYVLLYRCIMVIVIKIVVLFLSGTGYVDSLFWNESVCISVNS